MSSLDDKIEDETDNTPGRVTDVSRRIKLGYILDRGCRRNVCCACEKDWGIEKFPGAAGIPSRQKVDGDWCDSPNQEEKQVRIIQLAVFKEALRTDCSPNDRSGEESRGLRTSEVLDGRRSTDSSDVGERPIQNSDVDQRAPDCGENLDGEHHLGGKMHVMSEFQVLSERETLVHGHVTVDLEGHVGDGRTREGIGRDEFGDYVQPDLDV